jgi:hypothetical protein
LKSRVAVCSVCAKGKRDKKREMKVDILQGPYF